MPDFFQDNLSILARRYPQLAEQLRQSPPISRPESTIPNIESLLASLAPEQNFATPTLIAGLDDGQLAHTLQALPSRHPALPGFRPPVFMLCQSLNQLAFVLHQRDWQTVLSDARFYLFAGADPAGQFLAALRENPRLPHPKFAVTIEQGILPPNVSLDTLLAPIQAQMNDKCTALLAQLNQIYSPANAFPNASRLKILGLTSRFTTFLQHSMRDWLSAMRKLGHDTRLLIEDTDHEVLNTLSHVQACIDFRPDLILLIDHYRGEFPGLPKQIPAVMWIQDLLPNIFHPQAGTKQTDQDYCMGYGRLRCVAEFGYDEARFMPAIVGVNEARFAFGKPVDQFNCDVSYVGHTGKPADEIVRDQLQQITDPAAPKLFWDIFERIRTVYAHNGSIADPLHIQQIIRESLKSLDLSVGIAEFNTLAGFFSHQVNYALFRHQALQWLLDMDVNIHLYGKGWENHPTLKRFSKGVADNQNQLAAIYRSAKINLQITLHGVVHQRLFEGLCTGGFFLVRHRPGEVLERLHRPLWQWCCEHHVQSDAQLKEKATPEIWQLIESINRLRGLDMFKQPHELTADLRLSADSDFTQSAGTLFGEHYDHVAFASQLELANKVRYYLDHPDQRTSISTAMRQIVLDRMTYTAISRRLLEFIQKDQLRGSQPQFSQVAA